jgi:hypothetical protein
MPTFKNHQEFFEYTHKKQRREYEKELKQFFESIKKAKTDKEIYDVLIDLKNHYYNLGASEAL